MKIRTFFSLLLIGFVGSIVIKVSTVQGVDVGYDASSYISAANGISKGIGLKEDVGSGNLKAFNHFPPLYPLLLAIPSVISLRPEETARLLSIFLILTNTVLVGYVIYRTYEIEYLSILGSLIFVSAPVIFEQHIAAMTEAPFIFCILMLILAMGNYAATKANKWFIASALIAAAGYLLRYIGLSMVFAGVIIMLIYSKLPAVKRISRAGIFGIIGVVPLIPWLIRNLSLTGSMTNRVPIFHPPTVEQIKVAINTISMWVLPSSIQLRSRAILMGILFVLVLFGIFAVLSRKPRPREYLIKFYSTNQYLAVTCVVFFSYAFFLITSLTWFDASSRLTNRILSPVYVLLLVISFSIFHLVISEWRKSKAIPAILLLLTLGVITNNSIQTIDIGLDMYTNGRGFNSRQWIESPTLEFVRDLPKSMIVYSNEKYALSYLADRPVMPVPEKIDPVKANPRQDYDIQYQEMMQTLWSQKAILVIFPPINKREGLPTLVEVTEGLTLYKETDDGLIYAEQGFELDQ